MSTSERSRQSISGVASVGKRVDASFSFWTRRVRWTASSPASRPSGRDRAYIRRVRADWITVPLSVELSRHVRQVEPYLKLGTEFAVSFRSQRHELVHGADFSESGPEIDESSGRTDLGLVVGGGVALGSRAPFIELRYVHGLAGARHGTQVELTNRAFAAVVGLRI